MEKISLTFQSVLFPKGRQGSFQVVESLPEFFYDLNLDQVIKSIVSPKIEYDLKDYFCNPLQDLDEIKFRQEVFKDLEQGKALNTIRSFAGKMTLFRRHLDRSKKEYFEHYQEAWFLEAAVNYCEAVSELAEGLKNANLNSRGLSEFSAMLQSYVKSPDFTVLEMDTKEAKRQLSEIQFNVIVKGSLVKVLRFDSEVDHSLEVERVFRKFQDGSVKKYRQNLTYSGGTSHIDVQILDCVAKLFPKIFQNLHDYCREHALFTNELVLLFDREIQFYVSYLEFIAKITTKGISFCYPMLIENDKNIYVEECFDIALANKLALDPTPIICNSFFLAGSERVIVVSGPNQGGKTTFARMFGQVHFLAKLGFPVPGRNGSLFLYDQIFTHFENEEDIKSLRGKLQDDLLRVHSIFNSANSKSIIILNEIFTSTSLKDAIFLSNQIMERILSLDCFCIWVTFLEELSTYGPQTVSMVSNIVPGKPERRTYRIDRKSADGLSYAVPLAEKHHLSFESIKERISE